MQAVALSNRRMYSLSRTIRPTLSPFFSSRAFSAPSSSAPSSKLVIDGPLMTDMLTKMQKGEVPSLETTMEILSQSKQLLSTLPSLVPLTIEPGIEYTICGDTHGQFYDLMNIFKRNGFPNKSRPYIFNGDFVDRGNWSVENSLTLLGFKIMYPEHFHITRGNHEDESMNSYYGFKGEVFGKYGNQHGAAVYRAFTEAFNWLPLAITLNQKVLILHGGLSRDDGVKLKDIEAIDRNQSTASSGLMTDVLWSDPMPKLGRRGSRRGGEVIQFGPDVTEAFLEDNNLELLIRSHEACDEGYMIMHDGKCITIFSAPNYCDSYGNKGAFIRMGTDLKPRFVQFDAVPHPPMPAMYWAR